MRPAEVKAEGRRTPDVVEIDNVPLIGPRTISVPPRAHSSGLSRPLRRAGFVTSLLLCVVSLPVLAFLGVTAAITDASADAVELLADPNAPGYQALVVPTPVAAIVHEGAEGVADGFTVLVSAGEGGAVFLIPRETLVASDNGAVVPLHRSYAEGGVEAAHRGIERLFHLAIPEVVVVDADRWTELLRPVEPLVVPNTDELIAVDADGNRDVVFEAAILNLEAERAAEFLRFKVYGQSEPARLYRHELFWRAWLEAVARSENPDVVPGEIDSGLGRFVRNLSTGFVRFVRLDASAVEPLDAALEETHWQIDQASLAEDIAALVPYPVGAETGDRVRVRLLDGAQRPDATIEASLELAAAGAEIAVLGNADEFSYQETEVRYHEPSARASAEALAAAIGADSVVYAEVPDDVTEVTVIVGANYQSAIETRIGR